MRVCPLCRRRDPRRDHDPNTRECLSALAQKNPSAVFVMETGTHSRGSAGFWSRWPRGARGNARKLRAISQNTTKSDEEDARMLARLGRADPACSTPVKHRSESAQRALVQLKVARPSSLPVNQMNSVRFLVKSLGLQVPAGQGHRLRAPVPRPGRRRHLRAR